MNITKLVNKYILPVIIFILLLAFFIWAVTTSIEGFKNSCDCPSNSELRNGGCYSCDEGYKLSKDYYNSYCISDNPNNINTPKYIKTAKLLKVEC